MSKYKTQVFEVDNKFICMIEELNLISKGNSLDEAYNSLNLEKIEYFRKMEESGLTLESPSLSSSQKPQSNENLKLFVLKSLAISFMCLFLFTISGLVGGIALMKGISTVDEKVSSRAMKVTNLSEKEKLDLFKVKLQTFKPYLIEVKKVLNE